MPMLYPSPHSVVYLRVEIGTSKSDFPSFGEKLMLTFVPPASPLPTHCFYGNICPNFCLLGKPISACTHIDSTLTHIYTLNSHDFA